MNFSKHVFGPLPNLLSLSTMLAQFAVTDFSNRNRSQLLFLQIYYSISKPLCVRYIPRTKRSLYLVSSDSSVKFTPKRVVALKTPVSGLSWLPAFSLSHVVDLIPRKKETQQFYPFNTLSRLVRKLHCHCYAISDWKCSYTKHGWQKDSKARVKY